MLQKLRKLSLILVVLVAGCSTTSFLYNRINLIIPWYFGDYVDLSGEQEDYLDGLLVDYLDWHRNSEMPLYIKILDTSESLILSQRQIYKEDIANISILIENAWFRLEKGSMKWLLPIAKDLSDEQIDYFINAMRIKAQEYKEDKVSRTDKKYQKELIKRTNDSLKKFMGKLNDKQREIIIKASLRLKRGDRVWFNKRKLFIDELEKILNRDFGWEQELLHLVTSKGNPFSKGYSNIYSHNLNVFHEMLADVINVRSKKQEKALLKQIDRYRADIINIIKQHKDNQ